MVKALQQGINVPSKPLIVAHRGFHLEAQENTIEAYQAAINAGADAIEFDVRKTKDAVLIAFHDASIDDQSVNDLTFDELNKIAAQNGFQIPRIEDIFALAKNKIKLDVELKEQGYEQEVLSLLLKYFQADEFIVSSFNDESLLIVKAFCSVVKTGLILGKYKPEKLITTRISEIFPIKRAVRVNADLLIPHFQLLTLGFLNRALQTDLEILVWTVNDDRFIDRYLNHSQIAGIITDRVDLAIKARA